MSIKIVTDSTADIPQKLINDYEIAVVPLNVHFGDEVYKDGVEIWSDEFYHRLKNEPILPNTSQPAPGEFLKTFQTIAKPGDTIIVITISQEMSGTAGSARIAAQMLGDEYQVEVIDSRFVSMALGLIVLKAARLAKANLQAEKIIQKIHEYQSEIAIYFTLNSLEHLHRTGRIGKAHVLLGSLLNIKPILGIIDGVIVPIEKVRGNFLKVATLMVEKIVAQYGNQPLLVSIVHTELPEAEQTLQKIAEEHLNIVEFFPNVVGPIVGSHAGPNTIGIIVIPAS